MSAEERSRDRFTPTPRRSIHTYKVTETEKQVLTKSRDGRQLSHDYKYEKATYKDGVRVDGGRDRRKSWVLAILPKVCMLVVFLAAAYYTVKVSQRNFLAAFYRRSI